MDFLLTQSDILLVERNGILYRCSIENLNYKYLTIGTNSVLADLEDKMDELSLFILDLSANINSNERDFTSISALNELFELKKDAIEIKNNSLILDDDAIIRVVTDKNIVKKEDVESWVDDEISQTDNELDMFSTSMEKWIDSNTE